MDPGDMFAEESPPLLNNLRPSVWQVSRLLPGRSRGICQAFLWALATSRCEEPSTDEVAGAASAAPAGLTIGACKGGPMKVRNLSIVLVCFLIPIVAGAQREPRENEFCSIVCPSYSCQESCQSGPTTWTTCGQYYGNPANDLDGDGVVDSGDNCHCLSNPSQANCDGDSLGDACDLQNQRWDLVQDLGWCDTDFDTHFGYWSVELYGQRKYRDACSGSICYDRYQFDDATCPKGFSGCNQSASNCCNCAFPSNFCGATPGCANSCPF